MTKTIEIEVGNLHGDLDTQLRQMLGENYEKLIRENTEDFIHNTYRDVERAQEQAQGNSGGDGDTLQLEVRGGEDEETEE